MQPWSNTVKERQQKQSRRKAHQISRRVVSMPHSSADMAATARCTAAAAPPPTGDFSSRASVVCRISGCLQGLRQRIMDVSFPDRM